MTETHTAPKERPSTSRRDQDKGELTVDVKYKGLEETFDGNPETVWLSLNTFFKQFLPSFDIAHKLTLNVDLQNLAKDSEDIIAFTKEGPRLLVPKNRLTDNETLSLLLLARYLAHHLGKEETDELTKEELQSELGKDAKITSTRLGELVKNHTAAKTPQEKYKITTLGILQLQKNVLPKIKTRRTI